MATWQQSIKTYKNQQYSHATLPLKSEKANFSCKMILAPIEAIIGDAKFNKTA